jgi:hypothetical protein
VKLGTTKAGLAGVGTGAALGSAGVAFEREAYVPLSLAIAVYGTAAMIVLAGVVALAGKSLRMAWSLAVGGVTFFAGFMTAFSFYRLYP